VSGFWGPTRVNFGRMLADERMSFGWVGFERWSDFYDYSGCPAVRTLSICNVKYTSICIAHFYAKCLTCAQTWITQFYLQITPCLPLRPSRRASPTFGWYSFYRPMEGRRLSRPGWLVTYRNKVPPLGVKPGHGH